VKFDGFQLSGGENPARRRIAAKNPALQKVTQSTGARKLRHFEWNISAQWLQHDLSYVGTNKLREGCVAILE
jgi:hypothetical protein